MHQDNLGCINWTESVQGLRKVKLVRICYHYLRELVQHKVIIFVYVRTDLNEDNSLTKMLGKLLHAYHVRRPGLRPKTDFLSFTIG